MTPLVWPAVAFCVVALGLHFLSTLVALYRCKAATRSQPRQTPATAIIRPVCGTEFGIKDTLQSALALDSPDVEVVFCVATPNDPAVPLVRRLMAAYPQVKARLLVGDQRISINPKLNNCFKGWCDSTSPWVVLADSNVLLPPDALQRMQAAWTPGTGLVCSPPVGAHPLSFWAEVECAFLNTYQARWQYFADTAGLGFAQGKAMLWRRDILDSAGGIRMLAREAAEDAAATKLIRGAGLRVRLVDGPFEQPLGRRRFIEIWRRQARWARLRRASFPLYFAPELFSSALLPLTAGAVVAAIHGASVPATVGALAAFWYGSEMLLAWVCGWHVSWRMPLAALLRDLMIPALYVEGWRTAAFEWRGTAMQIDGPTTAAPSSAD